MYTLVIGYGQKTRTSTRYAFLVPTYRDYHAILNRTHPDWEELMNVKEKRGCTSILNYLGNLNGWVGLEIEGWGLKYAVLFNTENSDPFTLPDWDKILKENPLPIATSPSTEHMLDQAANLRQLFKENPCFSSSLPYSGDGRKKTSPRRPRHTMDDEPLEHITHPYRKIDAEKLSREFAAVQDKADRTGKPQDVWDEWGYVATLLPRI